MEETKEVKLHGFWASSDCAMVRHALKLKGIDYEYVEVSIDRTSESIVKIYDKVPILMVDGKTISYPLVIFEFVEETWKDPPLFPKDLFLRSRVRFWANFFYKNVINKLLHSFSLLMPTSFAILFSEGEAHEKATKEFIAHMATMEDGISKDFANGGPFIHGEQPGLLDVMMGSCSNGLKTLGAIPGVELLDKERMPRLSSAVNAFLGLETSTEIAYGELLDLHWALRESGLALASSEPFT